MSRYIDAEWLLNFFEPYPNDYQTPLGSLRACVDDAPTIEVPTWIPCSERLPKRQEYYICTCKDGSKYKRTTVVKWSNGWQLTGTRSYWIVLAWMPLPKPWKGADDE